MSVSRDFRGRLSGESHGRRQEQGSRGDQERFHRSLGRIRLAAASSIRSRRRNGGRRTFRESTLT
jgi:hypothetical protein